LTRSSHPAWPAGVIVTMLVVSGCGAAVPVHHRTVSPSPSPKVSPSPFTSPVASPGADVLTCSLPVYGSSVLVGSSANQQAGGFVDLPSGSVVVAPDTGLSPVSGQFNEWQTQAVPPLSGDADEESYDAVLNRWVPATPAEISGTGTQYAYVVVGNISAPQSTPVYVHLVTIASAGDQVIYSSSQTEVLGWYGGQILLVGHVPTASTTEGLLSLNPATGTATTVQPAQSGVEWYLASAPVVWGGEMNPADTSPPPVEVPWDETIRYDLSSGQEQVWSYHPGEQVTVVGTTAAGDPIETVEGTSESSLEVATSPDTATTLLTGPGLTSAHGLTIYSTFTDSHGTWVGTDQGLYLLSPSLHFSEEQAGNFANATIVGACT